MKLLYETSEMQDFFRLKNLLGDNGICFKEESGTGSNALNFLTKTMVYQKAGMGINEGRNFAYRIFVEEADFDKAMKCVVKMKEDR